MMIKKLTKADRPALFSLIDVIESRLENKAFWLPLNDVAKLHFFDDEWTEFYGMFEDDHLVGAAALFYNEFEFGESLRHLGRRIENVAEIGRAMVHPDHRGKNILFHINLKLLEVAKSKNVKNIVATIHPDNIPSQKSFAKLGLKKECTYTKENGYVRDILLLTIDSLG